MPLRKLEPSFRERPWGVLTLEPWFPNVRAKAGPFRIGEVWFETPEVPLLVKFLFAEKNLSVQVHPDDAYAQFHHSCPGKTEMWQVLAAVEGAKIAAGFREPVTSAQARAAALDGTIVNLLEWFEAREGDIFLIPAGTVHAIGAGLMICEIQQRSDITYRFYDYGSGRELHLDHALAVSHLGPHTPRQRTKVACPYFVAERIDVAGDASLAPSANKRLLIILEGEMQICGHQRKRGEVFLLDESIHPIEIIGEGAISSTFVPAPETKNPVFTL